MCLQSFYFIMQRKGKDMNKLSVKEISIYPVKPSNGLLGFASCLFEEKLSLNSIAIYSKPDGNGYRVLYPDKVLRNGKKISLFYPINKEIGRAIEQAIVGAFEELTKKLRGSEDKNGATKCN